VDVRREGDWIRVSVDLGPDIALVHDAERRWLHRVAIRHGGRFELRGNSQCLLLPADASAHAEVVELQRELEQAQLLGETYARELASVIAQDSSKAESLKTDAPNLGPADAAFNLLAGLGSIEPLLQLVYRELAQANGQALSLELLRNALLVLGTAADAHDAIPNDELARRAARALGRLKATSGQNWPKQEG
jgi:hypothetical protein